MSVPKHIFIDTSIFDQFAFNFDSPRVKPFADALPILDLTLVDPDPIFRERTRHLKERVETIIHSIEKIEKTLPLIASLENWPSTGYFHSYKIRQLINGSMEDFLSKMKYVKIGYEGINIGKIMTWYEQGIPPFGKGKKNKEFPDALSIAILDRFSTNQSCDIAVISNDSDFEKACSRRTNLLYYPSLAAYLQVHQSESERVRIIQEWADENEGAFDELIEEQLGNLEYEFDQYVQGEINDPSLDHVSISELYVVGLAEKECTVSFEVEIGFTVNAEYEDESDFEYTPEGEPIGPVSHSGMISSTVEGSALAKISFDPKNNKAIGVTFVELDLPTVLVPVSELW
ncbi:DUF4935 domain-containing protein [Pelagicoccus sp. NFK12]|uniref:DUF4935 domain-containing protein n=1 Tax=Pelagicoccus enzymogenes TaxID=2773457 RepID=A0A927FD73_9BACT|nr:PIN domain-containing protein [Pelagicoccus enzymogenes]MBD5782200.1 DUF4935 domain-containing protein [Pelagicoccus enzymogenes]